MVQEWECTECGYIEEGARPPARCPECGAPRHRFQRLDILDEEEDDAFDLLDEYDDLEDEEDDLWDDEEEDEEFFDEEDEEDF